VFKIKILDRYIVREVLGPFAMGLGILTFALVVARLLKLIELVVNHGVGLGEVLTLIGYIMPAFLELSFPMAVLLGVLLGFGRMSSDQELTAARACGIGLHRMAMPVLGVAIIACGLSGWLAFKVRPWANSNLRERLYQLTRTRPMAGLKEKSFNRNFSGLVVYVDRIDPADSKLQGVMISDNRDPHQQSTIIAQSGMIIPDEHRQAITLRLLDGTNFGVDEEKDTTHVSQFAVYDLTVDPGEELGAIQHDPLEMEGAELNRVIDQGRRSGSRNFVAETEMARRYAVPFATLLFAMMGVALGLKPARGGQSERFGVSLALFFAYYTLLRAGQSFAESGKVNPFIAMSFPDFVFAILGTWLLYRAATDRGDQGRGPGDLLWDLVERFERRRVAA
jgi:lipopolysaccharide export system permease protein